MWELDCEEGWALKNWCFWTVVLEKTLESPLDCKEIQPIHSEGEQSWDFFGRNDAKAKIPVLWSPHEKRWLIGKDSDAGRDCGQEEMGTTEDEMAGWHHGLDGQESEWTPGVGDEQGDQACCDSWGRKESDTTERLNWTYCKIKLENSLLYFIWSSLWVTERTVQLLSGCHLQNQALLTSVVQTFQVCIAVINVTSQPEGRCGALPVPQTNSQKKPKVSWKMNTNDQKAFLIGQS